MKLRDLWPRVSAAVPGDGAEEGLRRYVYDGRPGRGPTGALSRLRAGWLVSMGTSASPPRRRRPGMLVLHGEERLLLDPQNYSARIRYRRPARWYRFLNRSVGVLLTSLGLAPRDAVTLEVRGRRSGKICGTPVLQTPVRGERYLVSLAGDSEWVRNVRAAGGEARIRRGGPTGSVCTKSRSPDGGRSSRRTCDTGQRAAERRPPNRPGCTSGWNRMLLRKCSTRSPAFTRCSRWFPCRVGVRDRPDHGRRRRNVGRDR